MNQPKDHQPIALVTGASSGFGLLTSVELARAGYRVVASMRSLANRSRLDAEAGAAGVIERIEAVELDVTDPVGPAKIVQDVLPRYGAVDLLVNNAGYAAGGFTEELPLDEWRRQFETNFFGLVAMTQAVIPSMRERGKGRIINIGSISGRIGLPTMGPYVSSKFAVEGFSECLRLELKPHGIQVVLIEPGAYRTEIWSKGMNAASVRPDSPYRREMEAMLQAVARTAETAPPPDAVVRQIVRAATSPAPGFRYPVGKGVRAGIALKQMLPWGWWERIVTRTLKFR